MVPYPTVGQDPPYPQVRVISGMGTAFRCGWWWFRGGGHRGAHPVAGSRRRGARQRVATRGPGRIGMTNEAQVFLAGSGATEPTFRTTGRGKPEAQMRVAYTPRRQNWETREWSDGPSSFV